MGRRGSKGMVPGATAGGVPAGCGRRCPVAGTTGVAAGAAAGGAEGWLAAAALATNTPVVPLAEASSATGVWLGGSLASFKAMAARNNGASSVTQ